MYDNYLNNIKGVLKPIFIKQRIIYTLSLQIY